MTTIENEQEVLTVESPALRSAVVDYINADTARMATEGNIEDIKNFGRFVGFSLFAAGSLDYVITKRAAITWNADQVRNESSDRMSSVISDAEFLLENNPDSATLCHGGCDVRETYNTKTGEGVMDMVEASLAFGVADRSQLSSLEAPEHLTMSQALSQLEVPEERTEQYDSEIIDAMQVATETHVSALPDKKLHTTSEWAGNAIVNGGLIVALSLVVASVRTRMRDKKIQNAVSSHDNVDELLYCVTDGRRRDEKINDVGDQATDLLRKQLEIRGFRTSGLRPSGGGSEEASERLTAFDKTVGTIVNGDNS